LEVGLSHWKPRALLARLAIPAVLLSAGVAATVLSLPATAGAALPESDTQCSGFLANDPGGAASSEPNLLDYTFSCSTPISAYTLIISRVSNDGNNIDDYSPSANVVYPSPYAIDPNDSGTVSNSVTVNCGGAIPSDGINCYGVSGSSAADVPASFLVEGTVDPTAKYCSYLPPHAKPGTPAVARAIVEVVVTDNTGAQDGPFEITPNTACPKVPAVAPTPKPKKKPKPKPKPKSKGKGKGKGKGGKK
jgi:hypothetical protein